jgi:hypothetical protein
MSEEHIEPTEIEAPPFIYVVPSTFGYVRTTDTFAHPSGCELSVARMTFIGGDDSSSDALTQMRFRAEDVSGEHSKPVLLKTRFAFMSYEEPSETDAEFVHLYCELCGFTAPRHLAAFATTYPSTVTTFATPRFISTRTSFGSMLVSLASYDPRRQRKFQP